MSKPPIKRILTVSNLLTTLRIVLIPVFFYACLYRFHFHSGEKGHFYPALTIGLFLVIAISDVLDGFLARRFGQATELGAFLDPLGDKMMMLASYVLFAAIEIIPPWLAIGVVGRDLIIFFGWCGLFFTGHDTEVKPWIIGKVTALFQFAVIGIALIETFPRIPEIILWWGTLVLTVTSGLAYIYEGLRRATPRTRSGDSSRSPETDPGDAPR